MVKLVLLRHGESVWNKENRFTGWTDVDLSEKGIIEARHAGAILRAKGIRLEAAFTSVLKRATRTLDIVLGEMQLQAIPVFKSWRLNERHYGALQGLNKSETSLLYGVAQVERWRRSYIIAPPSLTKDDSRSPGKDPLYADVNSSDLPLTESLKDTSDRLLPYWHSMIAPVLRVHQQVLIAAHGNSLRALVKYLDRIGDEDIVKLEIPTGVPLIYELDDRLEPIRQISENDQAVARLINEGDPNTQSLDLVNVCYGS